MTPARSEHGAWPYGGEGMESIGEMSAVDCQMKLPRGGLRAGGSWEPKGRARCEFDRQAVVTPTCHPPPIEGGTAVRFGPLPTIRQLGEQRGCVPSSPRRHRWSKKRSDEAEDQCATLVGVHAAACARMREASFAFLFQARLSEWNAHPGAASPVDSLHLARCLPRAP